MNINEILRIPPYSLDKKDKQKMLNSFLLQLSKYHYDNSELFKKMMDSSNYIYGKEYKYTELPFIPVRLFKIFDLLSVNKKKVFKTMTSSGTSGQAVSRIYLDKETASNQTKVLTKIVSSIIGEKRIPMIIIDSESVVLNKKIFSARGAGILGFSMFGSKRIYALKKNMELNINLLSDFLKENKGEKFFLFGFTFMIWEHFYNKILKERINLDLSNAILIHGGGWKKLVNESISSTEFKNRLKNLCGLTQVYDYYGMVEQTGSIFIECQKGNLHASIFSDILIRKANDFSIAKIGEKGIIQVLSILPKSYPGHSLLTEDEGVLLGEDNCLCGRLGKYFKIIGRLKNAEIRGCSDTYAEKFS